MGDGRKTKHTDDNLVRGAAAAVTERVDDGRGVI